MVRDYLAQRVEHGVVRDRADVVAAPKEAGLDVPRQGKDYVTARDPETGKRWRLKGALYEHDFQPERLGRPAAAEVETDRREIDARYGDNPNLARLPMYCFPLAFKDVYDTADMRTTTAADIDFGLEAPARRRHHRRPATDEGRHHLRQRPMRRSSTAASENPGGPAAPPSRYLGYAERSTWGGQACNPYDTERPPRRSSSGSGSRVAVAANLVMCASAGRPGDRASRPRRATRWSAC